MRVLVTGQDGFTGRYLTSALAQAQYEVLPFDADITDATAVEQLVAQLRPDAFVHLAGKAFAHSDAVSDFYRINQLGTFHLLQAAAAHAAGASFLLASSATVYGNAVDGYLDEDTPTVPMTHYAASKLAMEIGARLWADQLRLVMVRPFNYTGRGQDPRYVIAKIVDHFRRRAPVLELGNIDVRRDFGDVRSVVEAYLGLLNADAPDVLNICSGYTTALTEVIATCSRLTGHVPEVRVNPAFVRQNEVAVLGGDAGRLKTVLPGWQPRMIDDTLSWMLSDEASTSESGSEIGYARST